MCTEIHAGAVLLSCLLFYCPASPPRHHLAHSRWDDCWHVVMPRQHHRSDRLPAPDSGATLSPMPHTPSRSSAGARLCRDLRLVAAPFCTGPVAAAFTPSTRAGCNPKPANGVRGSRACPFSSAPRRALPSPSIPASRGGVHVAGRAGRCCISHERRAAHPPPAPVLMRAFQTNIRFSRCPIQVLRFLPFSSSGVAHSGGLRVGGERA